MNHLLSVVFPCIARRERGRGIQLPLDTSKHQSSKPEKSIAIFHDEDEKTPLLSCEEAATSIVDAIFKADSDGVSLIAYINDIAHQAGGWSEWLADKIRKGMEAALMAGKEMSAVMAAAYAKAREAAKVFEHFVEDHPLATAVFVTVLAIGVLAILSPYILEMLGFAELGPVEGELTITFCYAVM